MHSQCPKHRRVGFASLALTAILLFTACASPQAPAAAPTGAAAPAPTSAPAAPTAAPTSAPAASTAAPAASPAATAAAATTPATAPTSVAVPTPAASAGTPAASGGALNGEMQFAWAGPLTGDAAQFGEDWLNGITMAVDEWNANGGLLGQKIVVKTEDDACDPKQAATVAQKIADNPDNVFLFGHFCSGATLAGGPIENKANLPMMTTSSNPSITKQGWKNLFRGGPDDTVQGKIGVGYVMDKLGLKKFALLNDKQAFGQGVTDVAKQAIEANGGTITSYGGVEAKDVDYSAALTRIIQAEQPEALMYCTNFPSSAGLMVKQARQLGFNGPIVGCDGYFDPAMVKAAGDAANKASDTQLLVITFAIPPYNSTPALQQFTEKFKAKFGHEPRDYEIYGYDYANVAFSAIKLAGSTDHQKVIDTLHSATIPAVLLPEYKFDANGDLVGATFYTFTIIDGQITQLK